MSGTSPKYSLDKSDFKELGWKALVLGVAFVIEFIATEITPMLQDIDAQWSALIVAVLAVIIDTGRRWVKNNRTTPPTFVLFLALSFLPMNWATAQSVVADYPESIPAYNLVEIKGQDADSWVYIIRRLPDGFRPEFRTFENGALCIWTGPPGKYDIDIVASKDGQLRLDYIQIAVTDPDSKPDPTPNPNPGPTPNPNPTPNPGPAPNVPDGKYDVAPWLAARALTLSSKSRAYAKEIADNFEVVVSRARAGGYVGLDSAQDDLKAKNAETFGPVPEVRTEWEPVFAELGKRMQSQRVPVTLKGYTDYYEEVVIGLRAVR